MDDNTGDFRCASRCSVATSASHGTTEPRNDRHARPVSAILAGRDPTCRFSSLVLIPWRFTWNIGSIRAVSRTCRNLGGRCAPEPGSVLADPVAGLTMRVQHASGTSILHRRSSHDHRASAAQRPGPRSRIARGSPGASGDHDVEPHRILDHGLSSPMNDLRAGQTNRPDGKRQKGRSLPSRLHHDQRDLGPTILIGIPGMPAPDPMSSRLSKERGMTRRNRRLSRITFSTIQTRSEDPTSR